VLYHALACFVNKYAWSAPHIDVDVSLHAGATAGWQGEQNAQRTMSLMDKQGIGALAYTRILCLLNMVHELLLSDEQASQRDIYYR